MTGALSHPARVWVLADERRGTASQALGVAAALDVAYDVKTIRHGVLARLPNAVVGASLIGIDAESREALHAPWPALVIAAGRRAAAAARWIKAQSGGTTVLVQIMYPGAWGARAFDLIAAPRHDDIAGANVVAVTGAPHGVSGRALADAAALWHDRFAGFARPCVAVLLGGATRRRAFGAKEAQALGAAVGRLVAARNGSVVVTSSPRTGAALDAALLGLVGAGVTPALVHRWGSGGDNPYLAFLALADALVVTGDSVTMLSEACAGTKPVYLYAPPGFATAKHARLHAELIAAGYVRPLDARPDTPMSARIESWTHPPLNAAVEIAAEIRRRFPALLGAGAEARSPAESGA